MAPSTPKTQRRSENS